MSAMIWDIFTALRKGDGRMASLSSEELRALATKWLKEILEADEIDRMRGMSAEQRLFWLPEKDEYGNIVGKGYSQTVIEEINEALQTNDYSPSRYGMDSDIEGQEPIGGVFMLDKYLSDFIGKYGIEVDRDSPEYIALAREMAKVYKLYLEIGQLRTAGNYFDANRRLSEWLLTADLSSIRQRPRPIETPTGNAVAAVVGAQSTAGTARAEESEADRAQGITITLRDFIHEYMSKEAVKLNKKTQIEKQTSLNRFLEYVGNYELHKIPVDKARRYRELYYGLPRFFDSKKYEGKSMEELAALDLDESQMIAQRTAYKNLSDIRAALNWGKNEGYRIYSQLPSIIAGPKPNEKIPETEKRDKFEAEDIKAMLAHRGYTHDAFEYSYQFWLPLLGLYTGARMGELCRINPQTDIKLSESNLCWYIDLLRLEDNEIKNRQSRRLIPLHRDLIETGFLDFIERRKAEGATLIFPELANSRADDAINAKASRWFNDTFRKQCGIQSVPRKLQRTDVKKDFHSFRHTFAAYAATHGVDRQMLEYCQGHKAEESESSSFIYVSFWKNKEAPDLIYKEVIQKMNYTKDFGIDIRRFSNSKYAETKDKPKI